MTASPHNCRDSVSRAGSVDPACSGCAGITHTHTCGDPAKQPQATPESAIDAEPRLALWCHANPDLAAARIEELTKALEPFATFANRFGDTAREDGWQLTNNPSGKGNLTMGDVRAARKALAVPLEDGK